MRLLILKIGLLLVFAVVALRLIQVQVIDAPRYQEIARKQYEAKVILPATRGIIYDRNGKVLVSNTMYVSFGADPKIAVENASDIAERFARTFGRSKSMYLARLTTSDKRFVWLERRVPPEYSKRINTDGYEGLIQLKEAQRIYHYDHVAGQLVGFTDIDNSGLGGVELACDEKLKGTNGYVIMQRDGLGRKRPSVDYPRVEPVNGHNVVLTIDLEYQSIAEDELHKGVERSSATSGLVVMMDPNTGEILAMANCPSINPNTISDAEQSSMKNRGLTDMFEPGSVFKIVTAAAVVEHDVVKPEQRFYAENGTYVVRLAGGKSRTITDTHPYGLLTLQEAMENSSNIVMAKLSDLIGAEIFYKTARSFGFGTACGVGLPGEASGELKKPNLWSGITLNTMAYGYEVAVTPIQIAAAYAAVANDGVLMKPYVVKAILNERNEVVSETSPQSVRRAVSKATAQTLTRFFVGVVDRGTGVAARLDRVTVAGKTGTSRNFVGGKYESGSYTASFVGYFPAEAPKVVCLVMLDNPRAGGYTGGYASAPIFKNIAEKVIATSDRFTRGPASVIAGGQLFAVPDLVSLKADAAIAMLASMGFRAETHGEGKIVVKQSPAPGTHQAAGGVVRLGTVEEKVPVPKGYATVPDVRRMTIRRALNLLTLHQLDVVVVGSGIVVGQNPAGGQLVKAGARVVLRCEPKSRFMAALLEQ